jgi:hypothetical protein
MTRIRRTLTALATLAGALLAFTAAPPAALADHVPPPGGGSGLTRTVPWPKTPIPPAPQVHTSSSAACPAGRSP